MAFAGLILSVFSYIFDHLISIKTGRSEIKAGRHGRHGRENTEYDTL